MDTVDKETRSRIMSRVRQRDTGPEMRLRRILHRIGLRYRLHDRKLPGTPDLIFPRFRAVVFVHGCFWHAHGCDRSTVPSTRRQFWTEKFLANKARDERNIDQLRADRWRVLVVWECALKGKRVLPDEFVAQSVANWLKGSEQRGDLAGY